MSNSNEHTSGFFMESAGNLDDARRRLRPMAELADIEATMAEIASRSTTMGSSAAPELVVASLDAEKVFARLNRRKALGVN